MSSSRAAARPLTHAMQGQCRSRRRRRRGGGRRSASALPVPACRERQRCGGCRQPHVSGCVPLLFTQGFRGTWLRASLAVRPLLGRPATQPSTGRFSGQRPGPRQLLRPLRDTEQRGRPAGRASGPEAAPRHVAGGRGGGNWGARDPCIWLGGLRSPASPPASAAAGGSPLTGRARDGPMGLCVWGFPTRAGSPIANAAAVVRLAGDQASVCFGDTARLALEWFVYHLDSM